VRWPEWFPSGLGFCLFVIRLAGIKPATESIPASHMGCWIGAADPDYSTKMEKVDRNGYYSVFPLCVTLIVDWGVVVFGV
jgi:hypothetical protein